ncbi:hypothetical protein D3C74_487470 [compost metagenome]
MKKIANGLSLSLEELFRNIDPANHTAALEEIIVLIQARPVEEHVKALALLQAVVNWKEE